ncbi:fungal hydrophobin [Schizopora paradoxa]|uniref:Hydrophobin n=1 Tax=Schizopora paradoxa TaxID=27342 RepID=A0A0H2SF10_9AGAM|nr:fungal hydrophobin [Schizopora paradoxa]
MFGLRLFAALSVPLLALGTPTPQALGNSQCDTGSLRCCSQVTTPEAYGQTAGLGSVITELLGSISGTIGVSCDSVNVIGASGNSCSAQPACCTGDTFNGLVTLGCSPVNVNV